jgi:tripeptidyl-peptidase-1
MGTTFVFSSGDYGTAGNGNECIDPSTGQSGTTSTCTKFNPSFPGTCPYILSVGATQIAKGGTVTTPEVASNSVIYSGGGFSNIFGMPSYQSSAVQSYFTNHLPAYTSTQYNNSQTSRGFPDVSANGAYYGVVVGGTLSLVFGTSASAPVFASVLTLINEARMNLKKSSLGFVNPVFYANPGMFSEFHLD